MEWLPGCQAWGNPASRLAVLACSATAEDILSQVCRRRAMLFLGFAASAAARCFYDLKDCSQRIINNGRKSLFILQNYPQAFTSAWASLATTSLLRIHVMEQGTIAGQDLVGRDYGEQVMRI
jgi:hypothetical protein